MMGFVIRSGAAATLAAVTVATTTAIPLQRPVPAGNIVASSGLIRLTASSSMLYPDPDQIDNQFIEFRNMARTDFHTFANKLGYVGKQMYIAVNFGETIAASAVFNSTDMLRGEGVLKNLSEMAGDVVLAGVYIVADNLYLALPGLPPIVVLPNRGPADSPPEWRRPLPPQPGRPLVVPFPDGPVASAAFVAGDSTPAADHSTLERHSGAMGVAPASALESGHSVVRPPADDESATPADDLPAQQPAVDVPTHQHSRRQPAGTTLQHSGSDDAGATHVSRRGPRQGRA